MRAEAFYITENGEIKIDWVERFFIVATRTFIKNSKDETLSAIRTRRRIAAELSDYFLAQKDFQQQILTQNLRHAVALYYSSAD